jgi:kynureninase
MNHEPTLDYARRTDEADPLRSFRERFSLPRGANGDPLIYLCGHSLGLLPLEARKIVNEELDDWGQLGVLGHEGARRPWIPYHENLTSELAHLTGAKPGEVIAMNSLTINLQLMLASFYRPHGTRNRILIESGAFSSDRHAVASHLVWHGLDPNDALIELTPHLGADLISEAQIEAALRDHGTQIALVLWPGVQFRTGQAFNLARIARAAKAAGAVAGFDLAHSIGNTPLSLHSDDADFAVWCGYKYLNGGPGAIGGCFVHERHGVPTPAPAHASSTASPRTRRLSGWWGHDPATRFRMEPHFEAQPGAAGWQLSNPSILSAAPLLASLQIFSQARFERLRAKSQALTSFLETLVKRCAPHAQLITPADPNERGCQLSIRITGSANRGRRVFERLSERGVVCDWREPDVIRVAPVPLYNRFEDVFAFAGHLDRALGEIP